MELLVKLLVFVWEQYKTDPASWTMAVLLFITLMFQVRDWRKKLKITLSTHSYIPSDYSELIVANTGAKPVHIKSYGYKKWNGEIVELEYSGVMRYQKFEPENPEEKLTLYKMKGNVGNPILIDEKDVFYFFIKTSGGKIFRKYTYFSIISWLKYFLKTKN